MKTILSLLCCFICLTSIKAQLSDTTALYWFNYGVADLDPTPITTGILIDKTSRYLTYADTWKLQS